MRVTLEHHSRRIVYFVVLLGPAASGLALMGGQPEVQQARRVGRPADWSHRRLVFSSMGPGQRFVKVQSDPRFELHRLARRPAPNHAAPGADVNTLHTFPTDEHAPTATASMQSDWSVSTGASGIAAGAFPATYTFDVHAGPSCDQDFIVTGINGPGSAPVFASAQGTFSANPSPGDSVVIGGVRYTATLSPAPPGSYFEIDPVLANTALSLVQAIDTGSFASPLVTAEVTSTGPNGGPPVVLSLGSRMGGFAGNAIYLGTSMAPAVFAWSGPFLSGGVDGQANLMGWNNLYSGTNGICAEDAASVRWALNVGTGPVMTSVVLSLDGTKVAFVESSTPPRFHVLTLGPGTGQYTNAASPARPTSGADVALSFGSAGTDTMSSPYVDYGADVAYVGDDDGYLYKFTGVFTGELTLVEGNGWPVPVGTGPLTSPVYDCVSGKVFIGDGDGHLIAVNVDDVPSVKSVTVGAPGTLVLDPILDGATGRVFVTTGNYSSAYAAVLQFETDLVNSVVVNVGQAGPSSLYGGSFDNKYLNSDPASGSLYVCGKASDSQIPMLYRIGFDANGKLNSDPTGSPLALASAPTNCSPLTEFQSGPTDRLYLSVTANCLGDDSRGCVQSFDITSGTPLARDAFYLESSGTGGIVTDNLSLQGKGSSIFYGGLGDGHHVVRLSQGDCGKQGLLPGCSAATTVRTQ